MIYMTRLNAAVAITAIRKNNYVPDKSLIKENTNNIQDIKLDHYVIPKPYRMVE
jgi:hypothetical protein